MHGVLLENSLLAVLYPSPCRMMFIKRLCRLAAFPSRRRQQWTRRPLAGERANTRRKGLVSGAKARSGLLSAAHSEARAPNHEPPPWEPRESVSCGWGGFLSVQWPGSARPPTNYSKPAAGVGRNRPQPNRSHTRTSDRPPPPPGAWHGL